MFRGQAATRADLRLGPGGKGDSNPGRHKAALPRGEYDTFINGGAKIHSRGVLFLPDALHPIDYLQSHQQDGQRSDQIQHLGQGNNFVKPFSDHPRNRQFSARHHFQYISPCLLAYQISLFSVDHSSKK